MRCGLPAERKARCARALGVAGLASVVLVLVSVLAFVRLGGIWDISSCGAEARLTGSGVEITTAQVQVDLKRSETIEKRQLGLPNPFGGGSTTGTGSTTDASSVGSIFTSIGQALSGLGATLIADLKDPSLALGLGIGSGTASGLNLTSTTKAQSGLTGLLSKYNVQGGIGGIAANLGTGIASSIVGLIDTSSLTSGVNTSSLNASDIQPYALALGIGLGNGTAAGLKLSAQADKMSPSNVTGLPDIVGTLAFSVVKSVLSNADLSSINLTGATSSATGITKTITPYLSAAGLGFGQGLGMGAQIALDLQPKSILKAARVQMENTSTADVGTVVSNFAMGLVTSLFTNVSVSDLAQKAGSGMFSLKDLNIAPIAAGFAKGLVQGAGDAIQAYGGLQALMNGTAPATVNVPNSTIAFDDTVGGGATGFGQGIGSQGVIVARQILGGVNASANASSASSSARKAAKLMFREAGAVTASSFNTSQLLDAASLATLTQTGLDAITSKGVGGLAAVVFGLINSGTIQMSSFSNISASSSPLKNSLPNGTIFLTNEGNTYEISTTAINSGDTATMISGVKVNGQGVVQFGTLLVLHIVFGMLLFTFLLPFVISCESVQNLIQMVVGGPEKPHLPKWLAKLIPISWAATGPTVLLVFIFGAVASGSGTHFHTGHGILGILITLIAVPASVLHFTTQAKGKGAGVPVVRQPLVGPLTAPDIAFSFQYITISIGNLVILTGFTDLSTVVLCVTNVLDGSTWLAIGFGLAIQWTLAVALASLDYLRRFGLLKFLQRTDSSNISAKERDWDIKRVSGKPPAPVPTRPASTSLQRQVSSASVRSHQSTASVQSQQSSIPIRYQQPVAPVPTQQSPVPIRNMPPPAGTSPIQQTSVPIRNMPGAAASPIQQTTVPIRNMPPAAVVPSQE